MARTFYSQNLAMLKDLLPHMVKVQYQSAYIGSYMSLDPCGRYHHCLSPNGATSRCEAFWEALEKAADRLGGWIEGGEGDPTDIYFCIPALESEEENCG
jgi:hypothetical protein